jgi:hypothetical protein
MGKDGKRTILPMYGEVKNWHKLKAEPSMPPSKTTSTLRPTPSSKVVSLPWRGEREKMVRLKERNRARVRESSVVEEEKASRSTKLCTRMNRCTLCGRTGGAPVDQSRKEG